MFTKICGLDGYYVNNLKIPRFVVVDVTEFDQCIAEQRKAPCNLYLSFCQVLPNDTSPEGSCRYRYGKNFASCLVVSNDTAAPQAVGQYDHNADPFMELPVDDKGRTSFGASFLHGNDLALGCGETHTEVIFTCDRDADWTRYFRKDPVNPETDYAALPTKFLEIFLRSQCMFTVSLKYDGACKINPPPYVGDFGLPIDVGWILIIILILLILAYLGIGVIINLARGGRTFDTVFPNYSLWMGFVSLVMDGFKLTFDVLTCQSCFKKKEAYEKM